MANSRKMLFDDEGIDLDHWKNLLELWRTNEPRINFSRTIRSKTCATPVFVDVTANDEVAKCYAQLLEKSISVVACNKVACSSSYDYYKKLKGCDRI